MPKGGTSKNTSGRRKKKFSQRFKQSRFDENDLNGQLGGGFDEYGRMHDKLICKIKIPIK